MSWKAESLNKLFNPRAIAVVGASDNPNRLGALALQALQTYDGEIVPVNPRLSSIDGMKCYASVTDVEQEIDLALICVSGPSVPRALDDCGKAKIPSAIIFAAGYKELGKRGEIAQDEIRHLANEAHIAVIGPNCLGAGNIIRNLNATFFPHPVELKKGNVAIVSQSGGVCGQMLYTAADSQIGVSKFVSVGNRVNVGFPEILSYLRNDEETRVICLFIEGTERARDLYDEMKETTKQKPIIFFKVGKTPAAREAAYSHTGSLAGESGIYSGAFRQAGGVEVSSVQEMMDVAKILSLVQTKPKGNNVGIVTHTLGLALIAAQTLEEGGIRLPKPPMDAIQRIQELLGMPVEVGISNPIDLLAQGWANPEIFAKAMEIISQSDIYDIIMCAFAPNYQEGIGGGVPAEGIIEVSRASRKPVISILSSPVTRRPSAMTVLENENIPVFTDPFRAAKALSSAISYWNRIK